MATTEEVCMPREVHTYVRGSTYQNDGDCWCWRGSLGIVHCYNWGQTRLCIGLHFYSPSSYQQCLTRLSDTWEMASIQSRQSAELFNVTHFRAKTMITRILMTELLFADHSALVAHSTEEMQKIVDAFSNASKTSGLKINRTYSSGQGCHLWKIFLSERISGGLDTS